MARRLALGLDLAYWSGGPPADAGERVLAAERLGYDAVWTAEAYGSDALTPLAWWGSRTSRLRLGTAVAQMPARTPAATAMAAMTLDHLSGGRVALGIGVSGPAVAEGWYGVPWGPPLARVREYVALLRRAWAREEPLAGPGPLYPLPLPGSGAPALRSSVRPLRTDIPVLLGAEGPRAIALAAEICDGWLALFQSPRRQEATRRALAEGFARPGARRTPDDFEVVVNVPVVVDDDVERAADLLRPRYALYVGGMGPRGRNFHHDAVARMGYEAEAGRIQDLFLAGRRGEAAAAVPTRMIEDLALIGPVAKIRHDLEAWRETSATMLLVDGPVRTLEIMAELVL